MGSAGRQAPLFASFAVFIRRSALTWNFLRRFANAVSHSKQPKAVVDEAIRAARRSARTTLHLRAALRTLVVLFCFEDTVTTNTRGHACHMRARCA